MTIRKKRGRPKGALNRRTIVRTVAFMPIPVSDAHGGERTVTVAEALLLKLQQEMLGSNLRAVKAEERLRARVAPDEGSREEYGLLVVPGTLSEAEWIRRSQVMNAVAEPPEMPEGRLAEPPKPGLGEPAAAVRIKAVPLPDIPPPRGRLIR